MMTRIIGLCVPLLIIVVVVSGCWDRKELNATSLITGIAIDKGELKKYKLTTESIIETEINPKTGGKATPSIIFSLEGDMIAELVNRLNIGFTRSSTYSHVQVIVISEKVAKEGLLEFIDFLDRNREIRNEYNLIIAKGVPASDVLKVSYPLQKSSSFKLKAQLETMFKDYGGDPQSTIKNFVSSLISKGREPVLTAVTIRGDAEKGKRKSNMETIEPDAMVLLSGTAIFKGERLQGYLDVDDTRYYLWTQNKIKSTSITAPCGENKLITVHIFNSHSKVKSYYKDDKPFIQISVTLEAKMDGTQCRDDMRKLETFNHYQSLIEERVKAGIKGIIEKAQKKYSSDIFGFGEVMNRQDYHNFKRVKEKWNSEFAKADIDVTVDVKMRYTGLKTNTFLNENN
ncbi:Ger(x)C family spore germination protein [Paenibacillus sp. FSL H8-0034]|uniref:Ger(x)C family spore germination protein n=1 Tax=Paenibacillus sp. FSL H8-0034 TaxID=2954671 RepID=UPI0030FAC2B8